MKIKEKYIEDVIAGDLVLCADGIIRTVSKNNIKKCAFMGVTVFGDSYLLGHKLVKIVENYSPKKP